MPGTEGPTLHVKGVGIVYSKDSTVTSRRERST